MLVGGIEPSVLHKLVKHSTNWSIPPATPQGTPPPNHNYLFIWRECFTGFVWGSGWLAGVGSPSTMQVPWTELGFLVWWQISLPAMFSPQSSSHFLSVYFSDLPYFVLHSDNTENLVSSFLSVLLISLTLYTLVTCCTFLDWSLTSTLKCYFICSENLTHQVCT